MVVLADTLMESTSQLNLDSSVEIGGEEVAEATQAAVEETKEQPAEQDATSEAAVSESAEEVMPEEGVVSEVYPTPQPEDVLEAETEPQTEENLQVEEVAALEAQDTSETPETLEDLFGEVSMDMPEEEQQRILAELGNDETKQG